MQRISLESGPRVRIAVASADANVVSRLGESLSFPGYAVYGTCSFGKASELLGRHRVDVLIVDQVLRGGLGLDLLGEVAGRGAHGVLRFLLVHLGDGIPPRFQRVLLYHDVIAYPAPAQALLEQIERWLNNPNTLPDMRTLQGSPGRRKRQVPPDDYQPSASALAAQALAPMSVTRRARSVEAFMEEIRQRVRDLAAQHYWGILGLPAQAPLSEVKAAFDVASMRFHPDRNRGLSTLEGKRLLNQLYAAMTEAYDVLSSPERSARYLQVLREGSLRLVEGHRADWHGLESLSAHPGARRFLKLAQTVLDAGDLAACVQNLRFALSMEPENVALAEKAAALEAEAALAADEEGTRSKERGEHE